MEGVMIFARKCISILLVICLLTQNVLASIDVMAPPAGHVGGHLPADYNPSASDGLIIPLDSNIKMDRAANGVQVVDINAPNSAGVSHNQFSDFNVGERGVVINNSPIEARSTIGGIVLANPNLVGNRPSNTIINEVISNRVSNIRGATEILGNRADYILANPNGINVNGGEFINVGRAILTTGVPELNSLGALEKITVDKGNISFSAKPGLKGLDLKGLDYFDIISRTTEINAGLHMMAELKIVTGRNEYNVRTKEVTPLTHISLPAQKPSISIDSYNLGGLYAGKIQIVSTEDGVGVNLGNMASKTQEITVSANGEIRHKNIKSASSLSVTSTKAGIGIYQGSEASASGSIRYEAAGEIFNENSRIIARDGNIIVMASKLTNSGKIEADGVSVKTKGDFHNTGKVTANGSFNGDIGQNLINKGIITAIAGDVRLDAGSSIVNTNQIASTSHNVHVNAKGDISNHGIIYAQNNLSITSSSGRFTNFSNAQAGSKLGFLDIKAEGAVVNHGKLQSELALGIDALSNIYNGISDKQNGEIISNRSIVIKSRSGSIDNRGRIIANDSMQLSSNDQTNNGQAAVIKASNIDITSKRDISNSGLIFADKSSLIVYSLGGNITNNGDIISIANTNIKALKTVTNTGSITSDAGVLDITSINEQIDNIGGTLLSPLALSLKSAGSTRNIKGAIESSTYVNIDSIGAITNTGDIISEGALRLKSRDSSINRGSIKSNGLLEIIASDLVENSGLIRSFTDKTIIDAGSLVNTEEGTIASRLALNIATRTGSVMNEGLISSAGNLIIDSIGTISNAASGKIISLSKAKIYSGKSVENIGEITSEKKLHIIAKTGITNAGAIYSPDSIHIKTAGSLINEKSGSIESSRVLNLTIAGNGTNHGKLLSSGKEVAIEAIGKVENIGSIGGKYETARKMPQAVVDAAAVATTTPTTAVTNATKEGHLEIRVGGNFINSGLATAKEADQVGIKAANIINIGGLIESKNNLKLVAFSNVENRGGDILSGPGALDIKAGNAAVNTKIIDGLGIKKNGHIYSDGTVNIETSGDINNIGGHIESVDALRLTSTNGELDNSKGEIKSQSTSVVTISGDIVNNSGLMKSVSNSAITSTAGHLQNTKGNILSGGNLTVKTHSRVMNEEGHIESEKALGLSSSIGSLNNKQGIIISRANADIVTVNGINNIEGTIIAVGDAVIKSSLGQLQNNKGEILSGGIANISVGQNIDNRAGHIESNGALTLTSSGSGLDNTIKGRVISGGLATINVAGMVENDNGYIEGKQGLDVTSQNGGLSNIDGTVISGGNAEIKVALSINNDGVDDGKSDHRGKIYSSGELKVNAGMDVANGPLGSIESGSKMRVTSEKAAVSNAGKILSGGTIEIHSPVPLDNKAGGIIQSEGNIDTHTSAGVQNLGIILAKKGAFNANNVTGDIVNGPGAKLESGLKMMLTTSAGIIDNQGDLISNGGMELDSKQNMNNRGNITVSSGLLDIKSADFINGNEILASGGFKLVGAQITNNGRITVKGAGVDFDSSGEFRNIGSLNAEAGGKITTRSGGVYNLDKGYINFYGGILKITSPVVNNKGNIAGTNLTINSPNINNERALFGENSVTLNGAKMDNSGIVVGSSITGRFTDLTNKLNPALDPATDPSGLFYAKSGVLDLNATGLLTNQVGGRFNSKGTMVLGGGSMNNGGTIDANVGLTVSLSGPLTNGGQLNSYANSDITASNINNTGIVAAKGKLTTKGITGDITNGGTIEAGDMELNLSGNLNNPGRQILSAGGIVIQGGVKGINNGSGIIQAKKGAVTINGSYVENISGEIIAEAGSVMIDVPGGQVNNRYGQIRAHGGSLTINGRELYQPADVSVDRNDKAETLIITPLPDGWTTSASATDVRYRQSVTKKTTSYKETFRSVENVGTIAATGLVALNVDTVSSVGSRHC